MSRFPLFATREGDSHCITWAKVEEAEGREAEWKEGGFRAEGEEARAGRHAPEAIGDLWLKYAELRAQHDPAIAELSKDEVSAITDATWPRMV